MPIRQITTLIYIVLFLVSTVLFPSPAQAWLLRPANEVIEAAVTGHESFWPPAEIGYTNPIMTTNWPYAGIGQNKSKAVFIPVGDHEFTMDRVYMLDPSVTWRFDRWVSRVDQSGWTTFSLHHSFEVTAERPTGNTTYFVMFNGKRAEAFDMKKVSWELPSSFLKHVPVLQRAPQGLEGHNLEEEKITPPGCATDLFVLREANGNQTRNIVALAASQAGVAHPQRAVYLVPEGGPWREAELQIVEFTGRQEAFSGLKLRGHETAVNVYLNPWTGFILSTYVKPDEYDHWTAGRPFRLDVNHPAGETAAYELSQTNTTHSSFTSYAVVAMVHPESAWAFTKQFKPKDFVPPPKNTYEIVARKIPHVYDLEEFQRCFVPADTRVFVVADPATGKRAVWETGQLCRWREQGWLQVPDQPGPDAYAMLEYEVPYFNDPVGRDGSTEEDGVTTYVVGFNPWKAFIAVVEAGGNGTRVQPPDFAPLVGLGAGLYPGKTLRVLETAVWPR